MRNLFVIMFDALFPPGEDALRVRGLTEEDMWRHYGTQRIGAVVTLARFQDPDIRALVHETKFHYNAKATQLLATLLHTYVQKSDVDFDTIIPIPLSPARFRARGYNQVHEVLKQTAHIPPEKIAHKALVRTRDTRPQTELGRAERLTNMRKAFRVRTPEAITGKHVLIVDDVTTTGATLEAGQT